MKFSLRFMVLLLMVALLLNGCLKVKRVINLNKDGSGTIEELILMKDMGFGQALPYVEEDLKTAAAEYGEGVTYKSSEALTESEMSGYKVIYHFQNINNVRVPEDLTDELFGEEMEQQAEFVNFKFTKGKTAKLEIVFPEDLDAEEMDMDMDEESYEEETNPSSEEQEQAKEMMKQMYKDMEMYFAINFNGKISKSNASFQEDNQVVLMDVQFGKILENEGVMDELMMDQGEDPDKVLKKLQEIPGMRFEIKKNLTIEFK